MNKLTQMKEVKKDEWETLLGDAGCYDQVVRANLFKTGHYMIDQRFAGEDQSDDNLNLLKRTLEVVQIAVNKVRSEQDEVLHTLDLLERKSSASKNIPKLEPSLRWAQSPNNIFIEVKYATRFDSPACLDIFDQDIKIKEKVVTIQAMCRNDQQLLKYEVDLELHGEVHPFEISDEHASEYEKEKNEYEAAYARYLKEKEEYDAKIEVKK